MHLFSFRIGFLLVAIGHIGCRGEFEHLAVVEIDKVHTLWNDNVEGVAFLTLGYARLGVFERGHEVDRFHGNADLPGQLRRQSARPGQGA
jgi:hypothetical protein